jgi:hypothetical protein
MNVDRVAPTKNDEGEFGLLMAGMEAREAAE